MATAANIIRSSLGLLGVAAPGEPVNPNQAEDCLRALNVMLDGWGVENLYAYATQDITHAVVSDASSLTIGPSTADITVSARPVRFEGGSYFSQGGVDYPMHRITEAEYNGIGIKDIAGLGPCGFKYVPSLPNGVLFFWPQATAGTTLHLIAQVQVSAFANLSTEYTLPPGYERALIFSLAEEVAALFEREIPPTVGRNAANARRFIKRANVVVPQLQVGQPTEGPLVQFYRG